MHVNLHLPRKIGGIGDQGDGRTRHQRRAGGVRPGPVVHVEAAVAGLLALGWSWWKIHGNRVKLLTALALPDGATENDLNAHMASGATAPSVLTPPNTVPVSVPTFQQPKPPTTAP